MEILHLQKSCISKITLKLAFTDQLILASHEDIQHPRFLPQPTNHGH